MSSGDARDSRGPSAPEGEGVSDDTVVELRFELLKQVGTLSLGGAGGALTLLETVFRDADRRPVAFVAVGAMVAAAILALMAQQFLVERMGEASDSQQPAYLLPPVLPRTRKTERVLMALSTSLFGAGVGIFVSVVMGLF